MFIFSPSILIILTHFWPTPSPAVMSQLPPPPQLPSTLLHPLPPLHLHGAPTSWTRVARDPVVAVCTRHAAVVLPSMLPTALVDAPRHVAGALRHPATRRPCDVY